VKHINLHEIVKPGKENETSERVCDFFHVDGISFHFLALPFFCIIR
jgi:hypothetical protein